MDVWGLTSTAHAIRCCARFLRSLLHVYALKAAQPGLANSPPCRPRLILPTFLPFQFPHPPSCHPNRQVLLSTGLSLLPGKCYSRLAWGPENLIAAACGSMLHFLDARTGEVVERIDEAHDAAVSSALLLCGA